MHIEIPLFILAFFDLSEADFRWTALDFPFIVS